MRYDDLDLNLIKVFLCVYESKSIVLASKKLFVSQPAITKSIKKLEEYLGGELFVRTSKGVVPTSAGEQFNGFCNSAVRLIDNGINKFRSYSLLESGQLNIGSSSTIIRKILIPFIAEFNQKYPNIKISITDAHSQKLEAYTRSGMVDLAILNAPIGDETGFKIIPFTKTTDCFIANSKFEADFLKKEQIENYPLIVQKRPSSNRDYFEKMCVENDIKPKPNFEIGSFGLITDFVANNLGIAYTVKDFVFDDIKNGRVKELKTDFIIKPRNIVVITNENTINSITCETFINNLVEYFKNKNNS